MAIIRETLWMALLADRVQFAQPEAQTVPLPKRLVPAWPAGRDAPGISVCGVGAGSHTESVSWLWQASAGDRASGTFSLVGSHPGPGYTAALLDVLLESFEPGAPPVALPPALLQLAGGPLDPPASESDGGRRGERQ